MKAISAARRRVCLALLAALLAAACKQEPDDEGDPHAPLVNPFTGVWRVSGGESLENSFLKFNTNGTGGLGESAAAAGGDDFSFLVYAGQDVQDIPSSGTLVTLSGSGAGIAVSVYGFTVSGGSITLNPQNGGSSLTLERVSGSPAVLELSTPFLGEWTADWSTGEHGRSWSWKYRADGTAKTFHHEVRHQFENSYVTRGGVLALFGDLRFGYAGNAVFGGFTVNGADSITVTERQATPSPAVWTYTRVSSAPWL
jgi:hypothetical protein